MVANIKDSAFFNSINMLAVISAEAAIVIYFFIQMNMLLF